MYHFDCLNHLGPLLCPCTMSLTITMFHVRYMYPIHSSAIMVDYIITSIIAAFTIEELYIHTHCHVTCVTFLWEENTSCPFAMGLDHVTCFGQ